MQKQCHRRVEWWQQPKKKGAPGSYVQTIYFNTYIRHFSVERYETPSSVGRWALSLSLGHGTKASLANEIDPNGANKIAKRNTQQESYHDI